jgi:hypothetical protein
MPAGTSFEVLGVVVTLAPGRVLVYLPDAAFPRDIYGKAPYHARVRPEGATRHSEVYDLFFQCQPDNLSATGQPLASHVVGLIVGISDASGLEGRRFKTLSVEPADPVLLSETLRP